MYAVVEAAGKQMRVAPGDKVVVAAKMGENETEIVLDKVLMISGEGKTVVGKPYIEGASVRAEIIGTGKMDKVLVFRHRAKKAINKLMGHRQDSTTLQIKEVIGG